MIKLSQSAHSCYLTALVICLAAVALVAGVASAQTAPMAVNTPQVLSAPVVPGQISAEIQIPISAVESFRLQVIAPVNGVMLTLLEPSGTVALPPNDPSITFLDGALLSPPLPGGVFLTPTITSPVDGQWKLQLGFPPASEKTVILATLFTATRYQAGIVLDRNEYRVGQTISVGMIVLDNNQPIQGLRPFPKKILPVSGRSNPNVSL